MKRRTFCQVSGLAAGSLFIQSLLPEGTVLATGSNPLEGITFGLQVATSPNFLDTDLVVNVRGLETLGFEVHNLGIGRTYYWRVNATSNDGTVVRDVPLFDERGGRR